MTSSADQYPGARPFERSDSGRFFGRTAEAAYLGQLWLQNRVTFLSGPAGIGKTSLLTAGVLPLVESNSLRLLPVGKLSGGTGFPVAALPRHNPYTLALLRSWSPTDPATSLAELTVDDFVGRCAELRGPAVTILAAIDRADDLFVGPESRQRYRRRFLQELADALQDQPTLHLLVSIREDALPGYKAVIGDGPQFQLGALGLEEARLAVEGPGAFASDAADELIRSIRTSRIVTAQGGDRLVITDQVEPSLLQAVCGRLQEQLRVNSGVITRRELRRRGDVDAALGGYCSAAIAAVAEVHDIPVAWLRFWLIRTFVTEIGTRDTAAEELTATPDLPRTVARALEDRHLLRAHSAPPSGSRWYELLSDRLIEPLRHASDEVSLPEDPAEYLLAAERARITGELGLAERYASEALRVAPDTALRVRAEASSLLGDLAYEQAELDKAEGHYRHAAILFEVVRDQGAVARLLAAVGRTLVDRGRLAEAIGQLRAAVDRIPADATVQLQLSWALNELAWRSAGGSGPHFTAG